MKSSPFAVVLSFAASFACAGPILAPPSDPTLQVTMELEVAGQFELQQTGNAINGDYKLTETDQTNSYEVINPSSNEIVGEFQLTETNLSGSFQLEQSVSDQYLLVETGKQIAGTLTIDQDGSAITGDYQLSIPTSSGATAPEPGSLGLAAMGAGLLVLARVRRTRKHVSGHPAAVISSGSERSAFR
jgi:hypothetical protein